MKQRSNECRIRAIFSLASGFPKLRSATVSFVDSEVLPLVTPKCGLEGLELAFRRPKVRGSYSAALGSVLVRVVRGQVDLFVTWTSRT